LGDYHEELRYRNIMVLYNRVVYDRGVGAILAKKTAFWENLNIQPYPFFAFFYSSLPYGGCATRKEGFLGRYNNEERPGALAVEHFIGQFDQAAEAYRKALDVNPNDKDAKYNLEIQDSEFTRQQLEKYP